jgi:hypothetical protein
VGLVLERLTRLTCFFAVSKKQLRVLAALVLCPHSHSVGYNSSPAGKSVCMKRGNREGAWPLDVRDGGDHTMGGWESGDRSHIILYIYIYLLYMIIYIYIHIIYIYINTRCSQSYVNQVMGNSGRGWQIEAIRSSQCNPLSHIHCSGWKGLFSQMSIVCKLCKYSNQQYLYNFCIYTYLSINTS